MPTLAAHLVIEFLDPSVHNQLNAKQGKFLILLLFKEERRHPGLLIVAVIKSSLLG
jgi:hypothetical protein